jgi:superfamily II DNA/RNA helicase
MSFENLGLSPKVLSAVTAAGFTTPTPIQAQAIPHAVAGRDVLGIAQTGTGKTASFALPMLTRLERGRARARMPRSLILEPTRELAAQVAETFEILGKSHKLTIALLIGGVAYDEQDRKLDRGADIVIATPGRLLDHFERGKLLLNGIEILVIDEADRMLDMGFIPDIERICKLLPFTRQTLFFSATMPTEIQRLVNSFLHQPERIEIAPQATAAATIVQRLKKTPEDPKAKREALRELMRETGVKNAIIFCNRKRDVGLLHRSLVKHGFSAGALHGDLDQHQRTATLDAFRNGTIAFLAASDVAARGLDIPDVSHIFNYDVPIHPEDYIHRIGRTGRAGREGFTAMLVTPKDHKALKAIETLLKQDIPWLDGAADFSEVRETGGRSDGPRGRRGQRSRGPKGGGGQTRQGTQSSPPPKPTQAPNVAERPKDAARPETTPRQPEHKPQPEPQRQSEPQRQHKDNGRDRQAHSTKPPQPARPHAEAPRPNADNGRDRQAHSTKPPQPATQAPRRSQSSGMGDHVPAFMMRSVRPVE